MRPRRWIGEISPMYCELDMRAVPNPMKKRPAMNMDTFTAHPWMIAHSNIQQDGYTSTVDSKSKDHPAKQHDTIIDSISHQHPHIASHATPSHDISFGPSPPFFEQFDKTQPVGQAPREDDVADQPEDLSTAPSQKSITDSPSVQHCEVLPLSPPMTPPENPAQALVLGENDSPQNIDDTFDLDDCARTGWNSLKARS